jgi:hypothetical protein
MRLPRYLSIVAVLGALALAGCGGGGGEETTSAKPATTESAPSLTKAELISQGDAICAEVNAAVGSVGTSGAGVANETIQVADLYTGMVESLKRLGTPKESSGYPEFTQAADGLSEIEGEVKLAAEREDTTALGEAATKATPALEEFQSQAAIYGFEKCSEGPSALTAPPASGEVGPEEEAGGVEVEPEAIEEAEIEEVAPEEVAPETGGAGGAPEEEAAPEGGGGGTGAGEGGGESGGSSGGVGPG